MVVIRPQLLLESVTLRSTVREAGFEDLLNQGLQTVEHFAGIEPRTIREFVALLDKEFVRQQGEIQLGEVDPELRNRLK